VWTLGFIIWISQFLWQVFVAEKIGGKFG